MVVLSSSILAKVSKMSCQEYKGYKWQCVTTQSPTQQHSELKQKNFVDQATPPTPSRGRRRGGAGQGGGGLLSRTGTPVKEVFSKCFSPLLPVPRHMVAPSASYCPALALSLADVRLGACCDMPLPSAFSLWGVEPTRVAPPNRRARRAKPFCSPHSPPPAPVVPCLPSPFLTLRHFPKTTTLPTLSPAVPAVPGTHAMGLWVIC